MDYLSGHIEIADSTVYSLLRKLKAAPHNLSRSLGERFFVKARFGNAGRLYAFQVSEPRHWQKRSGETRRQTVRCCLGADGLLTTYLQEESGGPPRKYYKLTQLGLESYPKDRAEYLKFAHTVETLLEDN